MDTRQPIDDLTAIKELPDDAEEKLLTLDEIKVLTANITKRDVWNFISSFEESLYNSKFVKFLPNLLNTKYYYSASQKKIYINGHEQQLLITGVISIISGDVIESKREVVGKSQELYYVFNSVESMAIDLYNYWVKITHEEVQYDDAPHYEEIRFTEDFIGLFASDKEDEKRRAIDKVINQGIPFITEEKLCHLDYIVGSGWRWIWSLNNLVSTTSDWRNYFNFHGQHFIGGVPQSTLELLGSYAFDVKLDRLVVGDYLFDYTDAYFNDIPRTPRLISGVNMYRNCLINSYDPSKLDYGFLFNGQGMFEGCELDIDFLDDLFNGLNDLTLYTDEQRVELGDTVKFTYEENPEFTNVVIGDQKDETDGISRLVGLTHYNPIITVGLNEEAYQTYLVSKVYYDQLFASKGWTLEVPNPSAD